MDKKNIELKELSMWIDHGIDFSNRKVSIIGDIEEVDITPYIRALEVMDQKGNEPITINISSFGGSVYDGLALFDIIKSLKSHVTTVAQGKVMSFGLILLLAGDERRCLPNTTFMAHQVSSVSFGNLSDIENDVQETKRLNSLLIGLLADNSNKNVKWWDKEIKHIDKFFDKKEAKKLGIITHE